MKQDKGNWA